MSALPKRSSGVLLSKMNDRAIAYDLLTETAHQMNLTAAMLLESCDGQTDTQALAHEWSEDFGVDVDRLTAEIATGMRVLERCGLVGRDALVPTPDPPTGSSDENPAGELLGLVHPVIDHRIVFRSDDGELLHSIDEHLGSGRDGLDPTIVFDVRRKEGGQVVLRTYCERSFPDLGACLDQLTSVLNEYAVWTHTCAAFHAGAVRSPEGEIVLLPAPSHSGKSTITSMFVAEGWDYLGDEAIGVRPGACTAVGYPKRIAIDDASRRFLGLGPSTHDDVDPQQLRKGVARLDGDVGPVAGVLLPRYSEDAPVTREILEPHDAVVELLANTLNLARAGQAALDAVCDLLSAESPVKFPPRAQRPNPARHAPGRYTLPVGHTQDSLT